MRITYYAATFVFLASAHAAEPARTYQRQEYPPSFFQVSEQVIRHGTAEIHIVQARKVKDNKQTPHFCRAWLSVSLTERVVFERYFSDIDPSGGEFGLFVPKAQPGKRFVAIVKIGDYDGRLYLIRDDGKTTDLDGGFYFVTEDGRFLFSEYASDVQGLTVFDLKEERVVFSVRDAPEIMQWYTKDRRLFFTERLGNDWPPRERLDVVKQYDFANHNLVEERAPRDLISRARKVAWAFDPRKRPGCRLPANPALQPTPTSGAAERKR